MENIIIDLCIHQLWAPERKGISYRAAVIDIHKIPWGTYVHITSLAIAFYITALDNMFSFSQRLLNNHATFFFVPLCCQLVNDESKTVREMIGETLKTLLSRVSFSVTHNGHQNVYNIICTSCYCIVDGHHSKQWSAKHPRIMVQQWWSKLI